MNDENRTVDVEHVGYKWDESDPSKGWGKTPAMDNDWMRLDGQGYVRHETDRTWTGLATDLTSPGHESPADAMDAVDEHIGRRPPGDVQVLFHLHWDRLGPSSPPVDDLKRRRLEGLVKTLYQCFKTHEQNGDSAFYVRPEIGWEMLEAVKESLDEPGSRTPEKPDWAPLIVGTLTSCGELQPEKPTAQDAARSIHRLHAKLKESNDDREVLVEALHRIEDPITSAPFFMIIEHEGRWLATFGGPYDSYTMSEPDINGGFMHLHYCHDRGCWTEAVATSTMLVSEEEHCELLELLEPFSGAVKVADDWISKLSRKHGAMTRQDPPWPPGTRVSRAGGTQEGRIQDATYDPKARAFRYAVKWDVGPTTTHDQNELAYAEPPPHYP